MYYSESKTKLEYQSEKKKTESQITSDFQSKFFYAGCGEKFLGFNFETEVDEETGRTLKTPGPRVWETPKTEKYKWGPLRDHLTGKHRGIVRGCNETHLPCVTDDLDRHDGTVKAKDHINAVLGSHKILTSEFNELLWLAEVNPKNGSTKFFGFDRLRKPLKVQKAKEIGKRINDRLKTTSIGRREIFPDNSPQVFLPMRADKITIVDTGILNKVERYRIDRLPGTNESQRAYIQAYSLWAFYEWLKRGEHCDLQTLEVELQKACAKVQDIDITTCVSPEAKHSPSGEMPPPKEVADMINFPSGIQAKVSSKSLDEIRNNPDAWQKNHQFALKAFREAKRPLNANELLAEDRKNHIYNGMWEDGLAKRKQRYKAIADFVSKTFDINKCGKGKKQRPEVDKKIQEWRGRSHLLNKNLTATINVRQWVDDYGQVQYSDGRIVKVKRDHVMRLAGIISHVSESNENDIPRDSIKGWWQELTAEGLMPQWKQNNDYYLACRQVLIDNGWLKMNHDYSYQNNQSKKGWILYETDIVGSVWKYPKSNNKHCLKGCGAIATENMSLSSCGVDFLSQRPPP